MRGYLEECLVDYFARFEQKCPKYSKRTTIDRLPMAKFCGIKPEAVATWQRGTSAKRMPSGAVRLRLMCFLHSIGYQVIELEHFSGIYRKMAELIGYGVISADQLANELGYSETATLFKVIKHEVSMNEERATKIERIISDKREQLGKIMRETNRENEQLALFENNNRGAEKESGMRKIFDGISLLIADRPDLIEELIEKLQTLEKKGGENH